MSYKSEFASNNTDLQSILDAVNALPDASSGASIETCTVTVSHPIGSGSGSGVLNIGYTMVENGVITAKCVALGSLEESVTFDAIVGSCVSTFVRSTENTITSCVTNGTVLGTQTEYVTTENSAYIIALPSSGDCTITLS